VPGASRTPEAVEEEPKRRDLRGLDQAELKGGRREGAVQAFHK
jgi:hypothetical protein